MRVQGGELYLFQRTKFFKMKSFIRSNLTFRKKMEELLCHSGCLGFFSLKLFTH